MSKRKGVTLDEKRSRILEIFHDSADVFVLKDIEKLSVKKGVQHGALALPSMAACCNIVRRAARYYSPNN